MTFIDVSTNKYATSKHNLPLPLQILGEITKIGPFNSYSYSIGTLDAVLLKIICIKNSLLEALIVY